MTKYRPDIDGLRGIAVLVVVIFHAFPELLPSGFVGVDIFFVISGYLISTIIISELAESRFSLFSFYGRRIRRIFPALIIVMIASYALVWHLLFAPELKSLGRHLSAGVLFISNFLLDAETDYFGVQASDKPMLHLWSLAIEEQFYLIWPLLLMVSIRIRGGVLALLSVVCLVSFGRSLSLVYYGNNSGFYMPTARFWELLTGAFVACMHLAVRQMDGSHGVRSGGPVVFPRYFSTLSGWIGRFPNVLSFFGVVLLAVGLCLVREGPYFPGWWATLPVGGAAFLISAGPSAALNRYILSNRVLVSIGLISYPLYLWHWPLLSIAKLRSDEGLATSARLVIVACSFLLAWLVYLFVEKRMRNGGYLRVKTAFLVLAMIAIGYQAHHTYTQNGYDQRYSELVKSFLDAPFNFGYATHYNKAWRIDECFFRSGDKQVTTDFTKCTTVSKDPKAPRVYLWGDSFAAHLLPGLVSEYGDTITLTQATASLCPPLFNLPLMEPWCAERNQIILAKIQEDKPDVVIFSAAWEKYSLHAVATTIAKLQAAGIPKIVLIGHQPKWSNRVPLLVAKSIQMDPFKRVHERFKTFMQAESDTGNPVLRKMARDHGIVFVAPYDIMCNGEGCLALSGTTPDTLLVWDEGHVTEIGAAMIVRNIPIF